MSTLILKDEELNQVAGGTVNDNMTPDGPDIDDIINGPNYEYVADLLAGLLSRNNPNSSYTTRTRGVNNNVNIYDVD